MQLVYNELFVARVSRRGGIGGSALILITRLCKISEIVKTGGISIGVFGVKVINDLIVGAQCVLSRGLFSMGKGLSLFLYLFISFPVFLSPFYF